MSQKILMSTLAATPSLALPAGAAGDVFAASPPVYGSRGQRHAGDRRADRRCVPCIAFPELCLRIRRWRFLEPRPFSGGAGVAPCGRWRRPDRLPRFRCRRGRRFVLEKSRPVTIVLADSPTVAEQTAAKELDTYLSKMTGVPCVIVPEAKAAKCAIYVGPTALAKQAGIDCRELDKEEWILRARDGNLIVAGGRPRGTLYGVYDLLERLGVTWPDVESECVPTLGRQAISWNVRAQTGHHEPLHLQRRRPVERHASVPRAQQDERPDPHPRRARRLRAPRLARGLSYVPRLHHQGLA